LGEPRLFGHCATQERRKPQPQGFLIYFAFADGRTGILIRFAGWGLTAPIRRLLARCCCCVVAAADGSGLCWFCFR